MQKYVYRRPAKVNVLPIIRDAEDKDEAIRLIGINKCAIWTVLASDKSNFDKVSKLLAAIKFSADQSVRHVIISKTIFSDFSSHRQLWNSFCQLREATVSKVQDDLVKIKETTAPKPDNPVADIVSIKAAATATPLKPVVLTIKNLTPPALATWKTDLGLNDDPPDTRVVAPQAGEPDDYIHLAFRHVDQARSFLEAHRTLGLEIHWRTFSPDDKRERSRTVAWNWAEGASVDEAEVNRVVRERASECGSTIRFNCNVDKRFGSATFSTMEEATRFSTINSIEVRSKSGGRITIRLWKNHYHIPDSPFELVIPNLPEDFAFLEATKVEAKIEAYAAQFSPSPPGPSSSPKKRKAGEGPKTTDLTARHLEYVKLDMASNSLVLAPKAQSIFTIFSAHGIPIRGRTFTAIPTPTLNSPSLHATMNEVKTTVSENAGQLSTIQESIRLSKERQRRLEDRLAEQAHSFSKQLGSLASALVSMQQAATEHNRIFLSAIQRQAERSDLNSQLSTITGQIFTLEVMGKAVPASMLEEQSRLRAEIVELKALPSTSTRTSILPADLLEADDSGDDGDEGRIDQIGINMSIDE